MRPLVSLIALAALGMTLSSCGDAAISDNSDKKPTKAVAQMLSEKPNPSCASSATAAVRKNFLVEHPALTDKQLARVCPELFPSGYLKPADITQQDLAAKKALQPSSK